MGDDSSTDGQMDTDSSNGGQTQLFDNKGWPPLKLTDRQQQLCDLLDREGGEKYQLGNLYSGAIRVSSDPNNPDRLAQAANSLREIIEKLLLLVFGYVRKTHSEFKDMRGEMADLLLQYKTKSDDEIKKKLHDKLEEYLELSESRHASRAEQVGAAVEAVYAGDSKLVERKGELAKELWYKLETCTHHGECDDSFEKILDDFEKNVDLILANVVAINQKEICKIVQSNDRSKQGRDRLFRLIGNNEANRRYFFDLITEKVDATWLPILRERGYFKNLPEVEHSNDGWMTIPFWMTMPYLIKMASCEPDKVAKIVAKIPAVDSPRVCSQIMEVATLLPSELSIKIKVKIIEYVSKSSSVWGDTAAKLLNYWTEHDQIEESLALLQELVRFDPDPKDEEKRQRRKSYDYQQSNIDQVSLLVGSSLEPRHRMDSYFFRNMMNESVWPLLEKAPLGVAKILIKAVLHLMLLKFHDGENDWSGADAWYKSIGMRDESDEQHEASKMHDEVLIDTMMLACRKVYDNKQRVEIAELDKILRSEKWEFFKQWRTQLYANYPDLAKSWIRELILDYKWYGKRPFGQKFWDMIKNACEKFGEELLTRDERTKIFEAISNASLKDKHNPPYTEDDLRRTQLFPFESVLFGRYLSLFQKLKDMPIKKEKTPPCYTPTETERRSIRDRSPYSHDELASLSDKELLNRINSWNDKTNFIEDGWIISINKTGFAGMFYDVFKDAIACNRERMAFWLQDCDKITHPVYLREMIFAMHERVKAEEYDMLDMYLEVSKRVLIYSDVKWRNNKNEERFSRNPGWSSPRWAVCKLVSSYLKKKVEPAPSVWSGLQAVLTMLCTQYDRDLDGDKSEYHDHRNPANKGLNCIRGRSLAALVDFALVAKQYNASSYVSTAKKIIEQRLSVQAEHILKPEEYAILGGNYLCLHFIDKEWARANRLAFFPQDNLPAWSAAFGAFISYCRPCQEMFEIVRENFAFAMRNLNEFRVKDNHDDKMINTFELRLFNFYLVGRYQLVGDDSLLDQYYQKTSSNKKRRGNLLYKVGDHLRDKDNQFNEEEVQRILAFFRERLVAGDFVEMDSFSPWLDVEQLAVKERLIACLKVLKTCEIESFSTHVWLKKFCKMLPDYTAEVVSCFAELVCRENSNILHIGEEEVKVIVTAGRKSGNETTINNANRAVSCLLRKNLMRLDHLDG